MRALTSKKTADMVGYSRLMEADETGTIKRQKTHRPGLIDPTIEQYHGRIVKTTGDGMLVEFASVVDAVQCAVVIQRAMAEREADIPEDWRIQYRIGINLGDVVIEEDDIFGDGVNIAARLEQIAEPGGVCISGTAYDHLKSNIEVGYESLGELQVKNIQHPVRVYRLLTDPEQAGTVIEEKRRGIGKRVWMAAAVLLIAVIVGGTWWWSQQPDFEPADSKKFAFKIPDKPSIAVLPFNNMSGDTKQEYFVDGMTEDLITDLSQVSGLLIIARNSVFTYKNQTVKVQQVAQELGVRYVLEGSVRRAGNRVRINAQLVDTIGGHHIWAQRYDREIKDVFALQDEVTQEIVSALAIRLTTDEAERLSQSEKTSPEAYDRLLRGLELLRRYTPASIIQGRRMFEQAIEIDPNYARAYANVAFAYAQGVASGDGAHRESNLEMALKFAKEAQALNPEVQQVHFSFSVVYRQLGRVEESLAAINRALEIKPNYADGFVQLAVVLLTMGRYQEGLEAIQKAVRLNPRQAFFYTEVTGRAHFALGDYKAAATAYKKALKRNPDFSLARRGLAASYAHLGRIEDAEWEVEEILAQLPGFNLSNERRRNPYPKGDGMDRYIAGLRKAGVPE